MIVEALELVVTVTTLEVGHENATESDLAVCRSEPVLTEGNDPDKAAVLPGAVTVTVSMAPEEATDCVTVTVLFEAGCVWVTTMVSATPEARDALEHEKLAYWVMVTTRAVPVDADELVEPAVIVMVLRAEQVVAVSFK